LLSEKEKELLYCSIEYLLKAELNKEKWIEREDINTLNNLLSEISSGQVKEFTGNLYFKDEVEDESKYYYVGKFYKEER